MKDEIQPIGPVPSVELPLPEKHYREQGIGSRTTFHRWGHNGLLVKKIGGRRFIKQSDLAAFLERIGKAAPGSPELAVLGDLERELN